MKKRLGQHFLFDPRILRRIADCSNISSGDTVVEIGAGVGTLTGILSERADRVIALEIDRKLIARLKSSLATRHNVEIIASDAMKFPFNTVGERFKVVANIPYYITTPLIFRLLEFRDRIPCMTLLLQKEIAERIIAPPGGRDYGVLSITVQLYTRPEWKFLISGGSFSPPPDVDSAVVHFEVSPQSRYDVSDEASFLRVVKTAFSQRRKTISNCLKSFHGIREALYKAGIDPQIRPEKMSIEDFIRLTEELRKAGN